MQKVVLISACLLGINCRYDSIKLLKTLDEKILKNKDTIYIPVCPEQLGGLPTPRPPAMIHDGDGFDVLESNAKVITYNNDDVTGIYIKGAKQVAKIARLTNAYCMITKSKSPSCSCCEIYDGKSKNNLINGFGVTAAYLNKYNNVKLIDFEVFEKQGLIESAYAKKIY